MGAIISFYLNGNYLHNKFQLHNKQTKKGGIYYDNCNYSKNRKRRDIRIGENPQSYSTCGQGTKSWLIFQMQQRRKTYNCSFHL